MRPLVSLVLIAAATHCVDAALAETTNENGYEVTRSQTVVPVPHGKVGRKTIDRETRTGNTEETDGNSSNSTVTVGGFMNRCPMPEGDEPVKFVVAGDFETSVVVDSINTDVVPTERKHYEKRMTAIIKVFVNDDLSVTEGELDGVFTSNMDGVRTGPVSVHRRFPIRAYAQPDWDAVVDIATATGDMAAAALVWNSSMTILESQRAWREPNACAEVVFDPPSETRAVASGETVELRVKYRTRDGQQPIPRGTWSAAVVQGGRVMEDRGQVKEDGTFVVKYVARSSSEPKAGDGMRVEGTSPGGYARDHWKIRIGRDYELHFESTIISRNPDEAVQSTATGTVQLTGSNKVSRLYGDERRLYGGSGTISFTTAPLPGRDECSPAIQGRGTTQLTVVDAHIDVASGPSGTPTGGQARIEMAYGITFGFGGGETVNVPFVRNFKCVLLPERAEPYPFWVPFYLSSRETDGQVNFLSKDGWTYVGRNGVVATKTLRGDCGGLCDEEVTVLTLREVNAAASYGGR